MALNLSTAYSVDRPSCRPSGPTGLMAVRSAYTTLPPPLALDPVVPVPEVDPDPDPCPDVDDVVEDSEPGFGMTCWEDEEVGFEPRWRVAGW